jgi:hypothetical protein
MDGTVKNMMSRMDAIDTRIDTKMTSMQTSLQNMITDKLDVTSLVAQVVGDASPFVTDASLKLTMEGFITQVNARINNLAPIPTAKPSERKKLQDTEDFTIDDCDMEEDENHDIAEAARKAAGRQ